MIRCDCGAELANRGCLRNHKSAGCLGAAPTLEDLYRVGRVEVMPNGCHEWRRAMDGEYGLLPAAAGRQVGEGRAHRAAFALAVGPVPAGLGVLHSCDNPPCVRPEHLRAGTGAENMADKVARGRHSGGWPKGVSRSNP